MISLGHCFGAREWCVQSNLIFLVLVVILKSAGIHLTASVTLVQYNSPSLVVLVYYFMDVVFVTSIAK